MIHRRCASFCLLGLLAIWPTQSASAAAPNWLSKLWPWKKSIAAPPNQTRSAETDGKALPASLKTVRLNAFTGSTGSSARKQLLVLLRAESSLSLQEAGKGADYTLSGHSVGGRVLGKVSTASGKMLLERTYAAPGLEENLKGFMDDVILTITGQPGLALSRIIFVSDRSGTKQIYLCDAKGKDVQQLTQHPHGAISPSLSSDGASVAFTSYESGFPTLKILDLSSGMERGLTDAPGAQFGASFSPEGQRLAAVMSFLGTPEIMVMELNGTGNVICVSDTLGVPSAPSWHPNGRQVLFADDRGSGAQLYLADISSDNQSEAKLIRWRNGHRYCADPEFSPDGRRVAYTTRLGSGEYAIVVKNWPAGSSQVIEKAASHPSWSPNGRSLCYTQHGNLWIHDLETGRKQMILSQFGQISEPRWMK
jgi:TolB protein